MTKLIIALGTTSKYKTQFVKEVLDELKIDYEIIGIKAQSNISEQPLTSNETKIGSINRAKEAFLQFSQANFGIGIEAGYDKNENGNYKLFAWTSIVDNNTIISEISDSLTIPKIMDKHIKNEKQLREITDSYEMVAKTKIQKYLAHIINTREPFIKHSFKNAMLIYLNKEEYI